MWICKVVRTSCCGCCCCSKRRSKLRRAQQAENEKAVEIQEARMELESESESEDETEAETQDVAVNECEKMQQFQDSCELHSESEYSEEEDDRRSLRDPDDDSEFMLSKFRKEITKAILREIPLGGQDPDIVLIGYASQFVAGTDYYLKIFERASGKYFHVRIYESLQGDLMLQRLSAPKQFEDPIIYF